MVLPHIVHTAEMLFPSGHSCRGPRLPSAPVGPMPPWMELAGLKLQRIPQIPRARKPKPKKRGLLRQPWSFRSRCGVSGLGCGLVCGFISRAFLLNWIEAVTKPSASSRSPSTSHSWALWAIFLFNTQTRLSKGLKYSGDFGSWGC